MLLAIETATEVGGVALLEEDRLLAEVMLGEGTSFNAALMPAVDHLLATCGRSLETVTSIALSVGPGSFTGLRGGLATALGLSFGTDREIVPVPTLAALSLHAGDAQMIAPLLDARKGQVYAGLYGPEGQVLDPDCVSDPIPWLESLPPSGEVHLLGPGARLYRNEIRSVLGDRARFLPGMAGWPRAGTVGLLGGILGRKGAALPPAKVELRYLRLAEAEERRSQSKR
jgi:tRNA threonylcarbamoyladenosine biosynthesis protein TsaB